MTLCTIEIELPGDMIGIGDGRIIPLMTSITRRRSPGELPVDMAEFAGDSSMRSGQRERSLRMVESRRRPGAGGVTLRAIEIELPGDMIGIGNGIIVSLVAGVAIIRCSGILTSDMAQFASYIRVRSGKLE